MPFLERLVGVKVSALFHDPPNKSWLFKGPTHVDHEKEAERFAASALRGTILENLYLGHREDGAVREADRLASAFDRWLINLAWSPRAPPYRLFYGALHNIFNPNLRLSLREPSQDKVEAVAKSINNLLRQVEGQAGQPEGKPILEYNALYAAYEAYWYASGLDPGLADTRTPTHTLFDHVYASSSVANVVGEKGFSGYYVAIDFPGVQRFVFSARKVGDLWAGSWMLSNLTWSVGDRLARRYGFDVIVSPSPRLNPYTYKSLISMLTGKSVFEAECSVEASGAHREICELIARLYVVEAPSKEKAVKDVNILLNQPLIPAHMVLLLPEQAAGSPDELAGQILDYYRTAWKELFDVSIKGLGGSIPAEGPERYIGKYLVGVLEKHRDVYSLPPQGVEVAVVHVGEVYGKLRECLVEGRAESCNELGLATNFEKLRKVVEDIKAETGVEDVEERLAQQLLYHVLMTRGAELAGKYGVRLRPVPRAFTYLGKDSPAMASLVDSDHVCSLCGEEPAIFKAFKKPTATGVDFDVERGDVREIISEVVSQGPHKKVEEAKVKEVLEKSLAKPGEALGPYCLLKRAIYLAFIRKLPYATTTDDVALGRLTQIRDKYPKLIDSLTGELLKLVEARDKGLEEKLETALKDLYGYEEARWGRDFEIEARTLGLTVDRMIGLWRKGYAEACPSLAGRAAELHEALRDLYVIEDEAAKELLRVEATARPSPNPALCAQLAATPHYAVVKGDADNIGALLAGRLDQLPAGPKSVREYAEILIKALSSAEVTPADRKNEVLAQLRRGFDYLDELADALGLSAGNGGKPRGGLLISPAWHSAVSLSLMLTAVGEYKLVTEYGGLLVFSGGDDTLALMPVHTALAAVRKLRSEFQGDGFKRLGGVVATSALTTGKSFSVRFARLWDVMSEEVAEAHRHLEEYAKEVRWTLAGRSWTKDSTVISDSRSGEVVVLPNYA
ncbi:MAG: type III-B CRISPR-associated protein Cas10/Cmr2, partial [Desulfurococcaceae archaeon]